MPSAHLPHSSIKTWLSRLPTFLCPALDRRPFISPKFRRSLFRSPIVSRRCVHSIADANDLSQPLHDNGPSLQYRSKVSGGSAYLPELPQSCPGCGAFTQVVGTEEQAGYYNPSRKSVRTFILQRGKDTLFQESNTFEDAVRQADKATQQEMGLNEAIDTNNVGDPTSWDTESTTDNGVQLPICNRCHGLLHHNTGQSIMHPSLQSIHQTISESPYSHNHIYHVLDAADFPLSLIPQLQRRLELTPQRSQNRRAKTREFHRGRHADMSFIITRSDLLAPQKEQVDKLMPYLVNVLRDALGSVGRDVRLGNVRCVSAKRGWWTKQVKDEIWERGGGAWMVGKVNVGKSNLFECVFPKAIRDDADRPTLRTVGTPSLPPHKSLGESGSHLESGSSVLRHGFESDRLLPPPQPEKRFPIMPTVSHLPGTTASPIRIPFGSGKGELIDLPGLARGTLEGHVIEQHRSDLVMRQRVKPEQYVIKPGQSLLIAGLIRITPTTPETSFLAYPFVPLTAHVTSTEKAIAISTKMQPSGVETIAKAGVGQKMALAGSFVLRWDVTKQRAGPLTSSSAAALSTQALPFVVFAVDILIEGCGWIELVAQVRKKDVENTDGVTNFPAVDVWSPNGDYIAERQPMNGWLLGKPRAISHGGRTRPRRSMKGVKKNLKRAERQQSG